MRVTDVTNEKLHLLKIWNLEVFFSKFGQIILVFTRFLKSLADK